MISPTLNSRMMKLILGGLDLPTARHKHFSFITRKNKIIAFGWNQSFKTHPLAAKYGHRFNSIHSELHAIKNFPYPISELRDYTLINARYSPGEKKLTLAKPCSKCIYFLSCFSFREVLYTDNKGDFIALN